MRDRRLKDEMRAAVQGDRERAEARRKAEEEGEYTGPAPPTLVNKPTREWKLPAKPAAAEAEVPQPELVTEETPKPEPPSSLDFLERLQTLFRRT